MIHDDLWRFALIINCISAIYKVTGAGVFQMELLSVKNDQGHLESGDCCHYHSTDYHCSPCRTVFHLCLTNYQMILPSNPKCTYGQAITRVLGSNTFALDEENLIEFPFNFTWPKKFSFIVTIWHETIDGERSLITRFSSSSAMTSFDPWREEEVDMSSSVSFRYRYRVICELYFAGENCSTYCIPRDDHFGHYTCDLAGKRACLPGWEGHYCDKALCSSECHAVNGYCTLPMQCLCKPGWQGDNCDLCQPYPGCQHGNCVHPWQCNCQSGWGGLRCNEDLHYCENHSPCKNGGFCQNIHNGSYSCHCRSGYGGVDCEVLLTDCRYHHCSNGGSCQMIGENFQCKCPKPFSGYRCESNATSCLQSPCRNGGHCSFSEVNGYTCDCLAGFSGTNCDIELNECHPDACLNDGRCIDEVNGYRCECLSGFTGVRCEQNMDDCIINQCLNGGSCQDDVDNFICHCLPGFSGRLCQRDARGCTNVTCVNGDVIISDEGICSCRCRPGYVGEFCSDEDEGFGCVTSPCQNGGTCVETSMGQKCICSTNFHGPFCDSKSMSPIDDSLVYMIIIIILGALATVGVVATAAVALKYKKDKEGRQRAANNEIINNELNNCRQNEKKLSNDEITDLTSESNCSFAGSGPLKFTNSLASRTHNNDSNNYYRSCSVHSTSGNKVMLLPRYENLHDISVDKLTTSKNQRSNVRDRLLSDPVKSFSEKNSTYSMVDHPVTNR